MPRIDSNRTRRQDRQSRKNNLMRGMGQRLMARYEAEEKTIQKKLKKHRD